MIGPPDLAIPLALYDAGTLPDSLDGVLFQRTRAKGTSMTMCGYMRVSEPARFIDFVASAWMGSATGGVLSGAVHT